MTQKIERYVTSFYGCAAAAAGMLSVSAAAAADIKAPNYIPAIDIYPTATFTTGEDAHPLPNEIAGRFTKRINKYLSASADINNLVQQNLGNVPFPSPNTIHHIYLATALDIHLGP